MELSEATAEDMYNELESRKGVRYVLIVEAPRNEKATHGTNWSHNASTERAIGAMDVYSEWLRAGRLEGMAEMLGKQEDDD